MDVMRHLLFLVIPLVAACTPDSFASADAGDAGHGGGDDAEGSPDVGSGGGDGGGTCAPNDNACQGMTIQRGFCSDFDLDTAGTVPSSWTDQSTSGSALVDPTSFHSCPHSLLASLPPEPDAGVPEVGWRAYASRAPVGGASGAIAKVTLDLWVNLPNPHSYVSFFALAYDNSGGTPSAIALSHHVDQNWYIDSTDPTTPVQVELPYVPLTGDWNHMTLVVPLGSVAGPVVLTYTDDKQVTRTATSAAVALSGSNVSAALGIAALGGTEAAFKAYYDDVVLTVQ